jgi:hypothetical protein
MKLIDFLERYIFTVEEGQDDSSRREDKREG